MHPSKARGCCMFWREGIPAPLPNREIAFSGQKTSCCQFERWTLLSVQSLGLCLNTRETDCVWGLLGKTARSQVTTAVHARPWSTNSRRGHCGWAPSQRDEALTLSGAVASGVFTPAGSNMSSEPLPRHLPGYAFPLQLMDFQMKGKISCALDLKVVSWILLTSS